jgi:ferritin-like metal-binding protein YciE
MGIFHSETFEGLGDYLKHQVKDLLDAEHRMEDSFRKMADKATNAQLKQKFTEIADQSDVQRGRLRQVFEGFGWTEERVTCEGTKGLIKELDEILDAKGDVDTIDAALIASANRLLHYKEAGYGSSRCEAAALGRDNLAQLLDDNRAQAEQHDYDISQLAISTLNPKAAV